MAGAPAQTLFWIILLGLLQGLFESDDLEGVTGTVIEVAGFGSVDLGLGLAAFGGLLPEQVAAGGFPDLALLHDAGFVAVAEHAWIVDQPVIGVNQRPERQCRQIGQQRPPAGR